MVINLDEMLQGRALTFDGAEGSMMKRVITYYQISIWNKMVKRIESPDYKPQHENKYICMWSMLH